MNDSALSVAATSAAPEVNLAIPTLPTFSELAQRFLANLPEVLSGLAGEGDPQSLTGSRPGWGG